ncbi:MAG: hypothetical protein WCW87_00245 [Candidatus Paceibacterota bacterium]
MQDNKDKHNHLKVKICISGTADLSHFKQDAYDKAKELGKEIALNKAVLVTGATTGFPLWAAIGAKEVGGISVGLSPASTEAEHVNVYKLPLDYLDFIIYTGFGYSGRNLLLTRSSDAVIIGGGRIGTINEFTIAYEDYKPIGILEGSWSTDEVIKNILDNSFRTNDKIIFDNDPKRLVKRVIEMVEKYKLIDKRSYPNPGMDPFLAAKKIL